jgi:cytochrome c biogenesis protein CcmG/thiol:disulfide interchange protein DsbE
MTTDRGQTAPLPDQPFTDAEGTAHSLRSVLEAGPLLLGIYKSSCASSKQMFPFLERLHQRHAASGLKVLGVSQDSENITRSFARRYGITFPILVEGEEFPISRAFEIMATPTIFLIEPDGNISYTTMGFLKPGLDAMGDSVADAVGASHEPLVSEADADVPMFVPG